MTATKYHISTSGEYAPCVATVRACTRGGHVTAEEYQERVDAGDPRYTTVATASTPLTAQAEGQFSEAQKVYNEAVKAEQERKAAVHAWEEENRRPGGRPILGSTLDRTGKAAKGELERILWRHDVKNPKAKFIIQDTPVAGPDAYLPPVKNRDKFDADIKQKTEAARAEAETNQKVKEARLALELYAQQQEWNRKRVEYSLNYASKTGAPNISVAANTLEATQTVLAVKRAWQKGGVAPEAQEVNSLSDITPATTEVNDKGEITNLWYANAVNGKVERITSYVHPSGPAEYGRESGHFLTDNGTKVSHQVRYANYRKNVSDPATGDTRILARPVTKGAKTYPTTGLGVAGDENRAVFATYGEVDSGG